MSRGGQYHAASSGHIAYRRSASPVTHDNALDPDVSLSRCNLLLTCAYPGWACRRARVESVRLLAAVCIATQTLWTDAESSATPLTWASRDCRVASFPWFENLRPLRPERGGATAQNAAKASHLTTYGSLWIPWFLCNCTVFEGYLCKNCAIKLGHFDCSVGNHTHWESPTFTAHSFLTTRVLSWFIPHCSIRRASDQTQTDQMARRRR